MNSKSIFQSKTFWANLLGGIVTVAGTYGGYIPPKYAPVVMAVGAGANLGLRLLTNQPVSVP